MKYSEKFTLSITMKEFYIYAIPTVLDKKQLHNAIKNELYHCWNGIVNGGYGGDAIDWKKQFYRQLFKDGFIVQTKESIDWYGDFSK